MLVIVAAATRLGVDLVALGLQHLDAAAAAWPGPRPPARGSRPAARRPFCSARSARSTLTTVAESRRVRRVDLVLRGEAAAVGEHGDVGVAVDDGRLGGRVVGRRRHLQLDADGGAELLDRLDPLRRRRRRRRRPARDRRRPPPTRLAMTMIAASATALRISVIRKLTLPRRLAHLRARRRAASADADRVDQRRHASSPCPDARPGGRRWPGTPRPGCVARRRSG